MEKIQPWLDSIYRFLNHFGHLTDAFVVEHFTESHWEKIPKSWQDFLLGLQPSQIPSWAEGTTQIAGTPLGLLALLNVVKILSIPRIPVVTVDQEKDSQHDKLYFLKVKLKKQHEITKMGNLIYKLASHADTKNLIDVGSGVGHLARFLASKYDYHLKAFDSTHQFTTSAKLLDESSKQRLKKDFKLEHLNQRVDSESDIQFETSNFGIVGLHTCGNLGPTILRTFVSSNSTFLVSIGCCYMKLDSSGFPMSNYLKAMNVKISYEALELGCHAIESHMDKLSRVESSRLKAHCYRAALETLLVKYNMKRAGIRPVLRIDNLSFKEYCEVALNKLDIELDPELLESGEFEDLLKRWWEVVSFYTLRILIAPLIETFVLLDRQLFLFENAIFSEVLDDLHLAKQETIGLNAMLMNCLCNCNLYYKDILRELIDFPFIYL